MNYKNMVWITLLNGKWLWELRVYDLSLNQTLKNCWGTCFSLSPKLKTYISLSPVLLLVEVGGNPVFFFFSISYFLLSFILINSLFFFCRSLNNLCHSSLIWFGSWYLAFVLSLCLSLSLSFCLSICLNLSHICAFYPFPI